MFLRPFLAILLFTFLPVQGLGQTHPLVIVFDEDDAAGTGYYDASFGYRSGGSSLSLGGPGGDKLIIDTVHFSTGSQAGLLRWKSAAGGEWKLFVATPGWATRDATSCDSLLLDVNGPAFVPAGNLPKVALESSTNVQTPSVTIGAYLTAGLDGDTATWQRVSIPVAAFQPFGGFSLAQFKDVNFGQGSSDNADHTLWFDNIRLTGKPDTTLPAGVRHPVTRGGDRCVILHWDRNPERNLMGYNVYRAASPATAFFKMNTSAIAGQSYVDLEVSNGASYSYVLRAVSNAGLEGPSSDTVGVTPTAFVSDDAFLDFLERTAVDYFWYEANPSTGLIKDRTANWAQCSIAATGFGLSALCIGVDRGWFAREAARERTLAALKTFWTGPQGNASAGTTGYRGFFYHFLDMNAGTRDGNSELSSGDTGDLLAGIIDAKQFFDRPDSTEALIRSLADSIANRVDWAWMMNGGTTLDMAWYPETGFVPYRYAGYCEAMIWYILGLGANVSAMPLTAWDAWTSSYQWQTHYGYSFVIFPPLFGHQASHCWIDFRSIQDAYMKAKGITYAENTRRATLAQRQYCILNPGGFPGYGANFWGLTACDGPGGSGFQAYAARGAPPAENDDGTLAPTAPASSLPFTPGVSIPALRAMYDQYRATILTPYGFCDAFNLKADWWDPDVIGFDQGTTALMIENYRSASVWNRFMQNPIVQRGLQRAGFVPVVSVAHDQREVPGEPLLSQNYPNPFNGETTIRFSIPRAGAVRLRVFNLLGQVAANLIDGIRQRGIHVVTLDGSALASGVYFAQLESGGTVLVRKITLVK